MRVLVVSSGVSRGRLDSVLAARGHEITPCTADEALAALGGGPFDLAVVDGRRAASVCRSLRSSPKGTELVILAVAGEGARAQLQALDSGADDHLPERAGDAEVEARLTVVERQVARLQAHRLADAARHESESRYRLLLESTPDGILITEVGSWRFRYGNPSMCRLLGCRPEELVTLGVRDVHPPEVVEAVVAELGLFLRDVTWRAPVLPCLRRDGEKVWAEVNATPVEWDGVQCLMGFFRDVTRRVRAEEAVRRAHEELEVRVAERTAELAVANAELRTQAGERQRVEDELRRLKEFSEGILAAMVEGVLVTDLEYRVVYANRAAAEMIGYPPDRVAGVCWLAAIPPDQLPLVQAAWARRAEGKTDRYELELLHHSGQRVPVQISGAPLFEDGRLVGSIAVFTNLAERRQAEAERVLLSAAVEQAAEAVVVTDTDGAVRYVNRAFERAAGVSRADAVGHLPWSLFTSPPDPDWVKTMQREVRAGRVWTGLVTLPGKDGPVAFDATIFPVLDPSGQAVSYVGLLRDVTEEKRLERQLWHAQKMEEIGKIAGGIAHDFNNLLMVILGTAELLERRLPASDPLRRQVGVILRTGRSAADLTRALLDFARQQVLEAVDLDLNQLVEGMVPLLRRVIPENIELRIVGDPAIGNVRADRGRVEQVLMNLCVNARDAMPTGGTLVIATGNLVADEAYVADHPWARLGPYVHVTVTDTGCGMEPAILAQVFKPFFTTKKPGKGTGLGMASVYGIVKQHEGMIDITSAPGEGTTVRVMLPQVERRGQPVAAPAEEAQPAGGVGCVLIVEDHEDLRRVLVDYLQSLGHRVLTAADGVEAMEVLERTGDAVRLVISDMSMPRMDGRELFRRSRATRPRLAFLFCTGYAREWEEMATAEDELTGRIDKPCDIDLLGQRVRELLAKV